MFESNFTVKIIFIILKIYLYIIVKYFYESDKSNLNRVKIISKRVVKNEVTQII